MGAPSLFVLRGTWTTVTLPCSNSPGSVGVAGACGVVDLGDGDPSGWLLRRVPGRDPDPGLGSGFVRRVCTKRPEPGCTRLESLFQSAAKDGGHGVLEEFIGYI
jgi:hypothetical protein